MSFVLAGAVALSAGVSAAKAINGAAKKKKALAAAKVAKAQMEQDKERYANLDTSNVYKNLENKFEDMTVNKQQAEMESQQNQQNQANILKDMNKAAGGSGIAGLAQAMANAGITAAQKATASIGAQEAANQKTIAQEASSLQDMERQGENVARQDERDKVGTLLGMSQAELSGENQKISDFDAQMWEGITDIGRTGIKAAGGV